MDKGIVRSLSIEVEDGDLLFADAVPVNEKHYGGTECWCHPYQDGKIKVRFNFDDGRSVELPTYIHNLFSPKWG